jgi:hypothetical protein
MRRQKQRRTTPTTRRRRRHTPAFELVKRLGSDIAHLPSRENLYTAVAGGALAADLLRAQALRKSSWNR